MSTINQIQVGETTYDVGVNLSNVSGINVSSPSSGQVLKYNGSSWVNGTVEAGGGSSETTLVVNTDTTISLTLANNTMYWCSSSAIESLTIAGVATGFEYASLTFTASISGTTFGMPENDYYCVGQGCFAGEFTPADGMRYNLAIHQEPDRIAIYVSEAL